ncbi:MAG: glycosyltransferase [Phycisphaerales bacterium]|nr:glycosyltransferase [Phycisphaerales bacterium]
MVTESVNNPHSKRPRVAVVYHFFAHYRRPIVEALARSEVSDFTFCGDDHDYESTIKKAEFSAEVRFIRCPTRRIARSFMWQRGIVRLALARRFDTLIFLGNANWIATWAAAVAARATGKHVIFWSHGFLGAPRGLKGLIRRAFFALAHTHMFYGNNARRHAIDIGWAPERLYVVHNSLDIDEQTRQRRGVSAERRDQLRRQMFGHSTAPIVIFTGRIGRARRLDLLVEAARLLRLDGVALNLLLVGDGELRPDIERRAREAGLTAHFTGACYDESLIAAYFAMATVAVLPAQAGLSVIHSLTYGVPVITHSDIASQGPEVEAIVPDRTGDLFERDSAEDLARVMRLWIVPRSDGQAIRAQCIALIERSWTPQFQVRTIERAVQRLPAENVSSVGEGLSEGAA